MIRWSMASALFLGSWAVMMGPVAYGTSSTPHPHPLPIPSHPNIPNPSPAFAVRTPSPLPNRSHSTPSDASIARRDADPLHPAPLSTAEQLRSFRFAETSVADHMC